jgi:hypothetical protein
MNRIRFIVLAGMILAAAISRLIPHPPNFTPLAALGAVRRRELRLQTRGVFRTIGRAGFKGSRARLLRHHACRLWQFCAYHLSRVLVAPTTECLADYRHNRSWRSAVFRADKFRGLGLWRPVSQGVDGLVLVDCFVVAIPFFRNTLLSDLLYSALLFGGLALAGNGNCTLLDVATQRGYQSLAPVCPRVVMVARLGLVFAPQSFRRLASMEELRSKFRHTTPVPRCIRRRKNRVAIAPAGVLLKKNVSGF